MLKFHRTSLMKSGSQTVVNTVNTVGVMGKGLAAAFKERYPPMFLEYKKICSSNELQPGSSWLWKGNEQWVLNFATKKHWRNPSKLEYVSEGLDEFRAKYEQYGIREIAFPRLGCGNGGLDWDVVKPLMVDKLRDLPISIFIHDFEKPIGSPEHDLPLLEERPPSDYKAFMSDLRHAIDTRKGCVNAVGFASEFFVKISSEFDLRGTKNCNELLASEEDIFQIWSLLTRSPVSRFDLPETPYQHALKVFSVFAELPYVRLINLANAAGKPNLAIEMRREHSATPISALMTH
jgi:O-acetyl-ADP-ribose deacetylase (regulator of RNase III)